MSIPLRFARTAVAGLLLVSALALGVVQAGAQPSPAPTGSLQSVNGSVIATAQNFIGVPILNFYAAGTACLTTQKIGEVDPPVYAIALPSISITPPWTISVGTSVRRFSPFGVVPLPAGTYSACLYDNSNTGGVNQQSVYTPLGSVVANIYDPNAVPPSPEPTPDGGRVSPSFTG